MGKLYGGLKLLRPIKWRWERAHHEHSVSHQLVKGEPVNSIPCFSIQCLELMPQFLATLYIANSMKGIHRLLLICRQWYPVIMPRTKHQCMKSHWFLCLGVGFFGFGRAIFVLGFRVLAVCHWLFVPRSQTVYVWLICYLLCSTSRITFYSVSFCLSSWDDVSFATLHFLAETQNTVSIHRYSYINPYYIIAAVTDLNRLWAQGPCSYKSNNCYIPNPQTLLGTIVYYSDAIIV